MRRGRPTMAGLLLLVTLAGCSGQPTKSNEPAAGAGPAVGQPVAAAPVAAAPAAATPAPVPATPVSTATTPAAAGTQASGKAIPSGYRLVKRNGKEVYCRSVTTIGSRFAEEMCFTREQLEEIVERTDSAMGDLEQSMKVCSGAGACGSR